MGDQNLWVAKIETKKFLDIVENTSQFLDDSNLNITPNGVEIKDSDRAMVCFIDTLIPTTQFESYSLGQPQQIGVKLLDLVNVLKRFGKSEKMTLTLTDSNLMIGFDGRNFTIPQIVLNKESLPNTKDLVFTAKAEVKGDTFKTAIEDCDIVGDSMVIVGNENYLMFWANGDSNKKAETTIFKGDSRLVNLDVKKDEKNEQRESRYSLEYLKKLKHLGDKVLLEFGTQFPLKVSCNNGCQFSFILAPRINENE